MPIIRSSRLYLCYYRIWCVVPWLLVVGGQVQGSRLCVRDEGSCSSSFPHLGHITKSLHTICGNNTNIVSSSWWWAYKCPKNVEQIISVINHSVASSWFFFSTFRHMFLSFYVWRIRTNGNYSLCCLLSKAWRCTDSPDWKAVVCWLLYSLACTAAGIVC